MAAQIVKSVELGNGRIVLPTIVAKLKAGGFVVAGSIQSAAAGKSASLWVQSLSDSLEPTWTLEVPPASSSLADVSAVGVVEHPEGGVLIAGAFRRRNAGAEIKYFRVDKAGKVIWESAAPTCLELLSCNAEGAFLGMAAFRDGVLVFNTFTRGRELKSIAGSAAQIVAHRWLYMLKWDGTVLWSKEVPEASGRPVLVKQQSVVAAGSDPRANATFASEIDVQGNVLRNSQIDGLGRGTKVLWSQLADGYLLANVDNTAPERRVVVARLDVNLKLIEAKKFKSDLQPFCVADVAAGKPIVIGARSKYGASGPLAIARIDTKSLELVEEVLELQVHEINGCSAASQEAQLFVVYGPPLEQNAKLTKKAILLDTRTQR